MIITEEQRDLISVDNNEYYLVQCISAEYAIAVGIALDGDYDKKFDIEKVTRERPKDVVAPPDKTCLLVHNNVFNLVKKFDNNQKTNYCSLKRSLNQMKILILNNPEKIDKSKIAISTIWDGLEWDKVKAIIEDIFGDTNIEILVCYPEEEGE